MSKARILTAATTLALASAIAPAYATGTITETYDLTMGNFVDGGGSVNSPLSTVTGSFTLTFDPTQSYVNDTSDIVVNSLNFSPGSPVGFTYTPGSGGSADFLSIGGTNCGAGDICGGTNDFVFQLKFTDPNNPLTPNCTDPDYSCGNVPANAYPDGYTLAAYQNDFWIATHGAVTNSVPEPATLSLLGLGIAGLGFMRKRQAK